MPINPRMELVGARIGDETVEVTLSNGDGLLYLEGTPEQIAALCAAMDEVAVLATASDEPAWVIDVRVGDQLVRLGIGRGRVRLLIGPA